MKLNRGITIISLVIVIILLLIIAGISVGAGQGVIKKSELENEKTNMLLIKAKAKQYLENASFQLGTSFEKLTDKNEKSARIESAKAELKGTQITSDNIAQFSNFISQNDLNATNVFYYFLSDSDLSDMGIGDVKSDEKNGIFVDKYDLANNEIEVYNSKGYEEDSKTYYSLTDIENLN